jgi:rfaE bifunctional protein nucleotidyltransferase chain/domain
LDKWQIINRKILTLDELRRKILSWRLTGNKIVFTNGCFDILHRGHLKLLLEAAALGQVLVVGVNSDASVRRLKGVNRPVNNAQDRLMALAAMEFVDAVVLFEEDDPGLLIQAILPEVLVKGNDYTIDQIAGAREVTGSGGKVVLVPLLEGYSTSALLEKMGRPV